MRQAAYIAAVAWLAMGAGIEAVRGDAAATNHASALAATQPAAPERVAVPEAAKQAAALREVQDVFKDEYADRKPEAREALGRKLLSQAEETTGTAPIRYVLYREAMRVAAGCGDVETGIRAADGVSAAYAVDGDQARLEVLDAAAPVAKLEGQRLIVEALAGMTSRALLREDFAAALRYVSKAQAAARETREPALIADLQKQATEIGQLQVQSAKVATARKKLAEAPEDPVANLVVGRFLCLGKGDWEAGLPYLAKGDDAALKALAQLELAKPTAAKDLVALGDKWWEWGDRQPDSASQQDGRNRGAEFYRKALPELAGFDKQKVEGKLLKLEADRVIDPKQVDLLTVIKPDKHTIKGHWEKTAGSLVAKKESGVVGGSLCVIAAPIAPQGDYEVAVQFVVNEATEIAVTVPVDKTAVSVYMYQYGIRLASARYGGIRSGVVYRTPLAMRQFTQAAMTDHKAHVLNVHVEVKGDKAGILVKLDGREHLLWEGPSNDLSATGIWAVPARESLGLGAVGGSATFQKASVRMIRGEAKLLKDDAVKKGG